jgi:hypothetical protein
MSAEALPVTPADPAHVHLVGLDGEMSSASLADGGRLIQAGLAARTSDGIEIFTSLISWDDSDLTWDARAEAVHGIARHQLHTAPTPAHVDIAAQQFLTRHFPDATSPAADGDGREADYDSTPDPAEDHGASYRDTGDRKPEAPGTREPRQTRTRLVTVGFNVAAFDHPFFRHALPHTTSLISRRAVDLNALCFALDGWDPNPNITTPRTWTGWKRSAKRYANARLTTEGHPGADHDAGWDAAQALYALEYLRAHIHVSRRPDRHSRRDSSRHLGVAALERLRTLIGDASLDQLLTRLHATGLEARDWLGRANQHLGGEAPYQRLIAGDVAAVLSAADHT